MSKDPYSGLGGGFPGSGYGEQIIHRRRAGTSGKFGFYNFTGLNLPKWEAGKVLRAAGTRNVKVIDWGNSTTAGFGGAPAQVNANAFSRFAALAPLLGNASISSFFADHNITAAGSGILLSTFDNRIALGSWVGGSAVFGGLALGATAATPLTFTPLNPVDTFEIYYATAPGFGTTSYQIDAGSTTTFDQNIAIAFAKVPTTAALGLHTLKLAQVSGFVALIGVIAYNSAAKEFSLINAGNCGATSAVLTDTTGGFPWLNVAAVTQLAPDLTFIEGGQVNDWLAGTSRATVLANLQTMITAAKTTGDVILTTANPSQSSIGVPYLTQQGYVDDMIALARSNNIPCIDIWRLFGTWEIANASGLMFDALHPNGAGQAKIAGFMNTGLASGFRAA